MRRTINKGTARTRGPSPAAATAVAMALQCPAQAIQARGAGPAAQTCAASATMSPQFEKRVEQPKLCAV